MAPALASALPPGPTSSLPSVPAAVIQGLVSSATGQAKLECDAAGQCAIKLVGLPISQLDATCQAGECLVPTDDQLNITDSECLGREPGAEPEIASAEARPAG